MLPLLVLTVLFLTIWLWGMFGRGAAELLQPWLHVPLVSALICLVMTVGVWIR